jgi:hypothetical protein
MLEALSAYGEKVREEVVMLPIDEYEAQQLMAMDDDGCPNYPDEDYGTEGDAPHDLDYVAMLPIDPPDEGGKVGRPPAA